MSAAALAHVLDALAGEAPAAVARGRAALAQVLAWTASSSWGQVAWSFSDLANGSPVELVWRPGRPGLFWTAEPAAPEWPTAQRVEHALALAGTLGAHFARGDRAEIRALADGSTAPWPIWLGGRHDAAGDACKLYLRTGALSAPALRGGDRPVMLGLSPDGGRELYWQRAARQPGDCWRLAREPGLADLAWQLDAALGEWTGHGLDAEHGPGLGLSLKRDPCGKVAALAAFLHIRHVGDIGRLRRRMLDGAGPNPAMAHLWAGGWLTPLGLSLTATGAGGSPARGLRCRHGACTRRRAAGSEGSGHVKEQAVEP